MILPGSCVIFIWTIVCCRAVNPAPQPNVISEGKKHSLFLWMHLSSGANFSQCVQLAAQLPSMVEKISPSNSSSPEELVFAGVGFGYHVYSKVTNSSLKFEYYYRRGSLGDMPDTGGDIFVHAKSDTQGKLYGLSSLFVSSFPRGSIRCYEDTYSFTYERNRDLSFFIDGTMNPSGSDERARVAVVPESGGSFCLSQKWVHNMERISRYNDTTLESFIGRTRDLSREIVNKSECSHLARVTGTTAFSPVRPFQIVRQSQPYGTVSGKSGLFFIAFASSTENFDFMLDRMVGKSLDGVSDCVMKISQCIQSNYWFFPGVEQLRRIKDSV